MNPILKNGRGMKMLFELSTPSEMQRCFFVLFVRVTREEFGISNFNGREELWFEADRLEITLQ